MYVINKIKIRATYIYICVCVYVLSTVYVMAALFEKKFRWKVLMFIKFIHMLRKKKHFMLFK